jgi:alpha-mannosidase
MIILYPGYSFDGLLSDRSEVEAEQLLAAWTAAFHPALLEHFGELPRWECAGTPPFTGENESFIVSPCCESFLPTVELEQDDNQSHSQPRLTVRPFENRQQLVENLLEEYQHQDHGFEDTFVADCYALGTTYFFTDLLIRKLHYASLMDDSQVSEQVFDAIKSYRNKELENANDHLRRAYELVCTSKEYYYPTATFILEMTLFAPLKNSEYFQTILREQKHVNLFLPAERLRELPQTLPDAFTALQQAVANGKVNFIADGIEANSGTLLLPLLDTAETILVGQRVFQDLLNVRPAVFGKLTACLHPLLPQLLKLAGYKAVVYFAPLDGWKTSNGGNSKMIWQGADGTRIDALIRYPFDGSAAADFFELASQMGETINSDQTPTAVIAQFPVPPKQRWLDELRQMNKFADSLAVFTPIEKYFEDTPRSGGVQRIGFDEYPVRFLNDPDEENPISRWNECYQRNVQRIIGSAWDIMKKMLRTEENLADTLIKNGRPAAGVLVMNPFSFPRKVYLDVSDWQTLPPLSDTVELANETKTNKELLVNVPPMGYTFIEQASLPPETEKNTKEKTKEPSLIQSLFRPLRVSPKFDVPPPMIRKQSEELKNKTARTVYVLENEVFTVKIDAATGMLRSLLTSNSRFNRLSQQTGFRFPKEQRQNDVRSENDPNWGYSLSTADTMEIENGALTSKLHITGRLVDAEGQTITNYRQVFIIRRRSRILESKITFDEIHYEPLALASVPKSLWDSYFALRFAWHDNTLSCRGGLADGAHCIDAFSKQGSKFYAPRFVDLRSDDGKQSLTFFTEGLPFHRWFGERQLDTILMTGKETAKTFRYAIGVDVRYPVPASLEFLAKDDFAVRTERCPHIASSWFFHIEAKNVLVLKWEPLLDGETGKVSGLRVFLLETDGQRASFAFRLFCEPRKATATNFHGEERKEFKVESDSIFIDMHAHELLPLVIIV